MAEADGSSAWERQVGAGDKIPEPSHGTWFRPRLSCEYEGHNDFQISSTLTRLNMPSRLTKDPPSI